MCFPFLRTFLLRQFCHSLWYGFFFTNIVLIKSKTKYLSHCWNFSQARLGNNFHFKDRIPKDLTSGVVINFSMDSAISLIMINVWDTWMLELVNILVYRHLPKSKLSLRTPPWTIMSHFATIQHPMTSTFRGEGRGVKAKMRCYRT